MNRERLKEFLDAKVKEYNTPDFIAPDPVSIPHMFHLRQDIEISGFFAAIFAWGNRVTIINKSKELMRLMDHSPYQFCMYHSKKDLEGLFSFKHRTFTTTDLLYFVSFLKMHYTRYDSLEPAFSQWMNKGDENTRYALDGFYRYFFSLEDVPSRTLKHIACPAKKASCKRLSMYLRWMVRQDENGVDFGLWRSILPSQLVIPLDLHVARVATAFGLLTRPTADWLSVEQLTRHLKEFDPSDPAKYDFALFALGTLEKF